ncbi:YafY family protein [Aquimarina sp. 2201CG5-10]|uniref:helix-turn-helix transcriptional regulator n=1 Tax=Aquimarina callyspongiae TaxID=3098150 RepID=UPI002AB3C8DD|nr:YafY family protein [Aquimarina sp. 2201CG5-10]MDY8134281.1 YafY family protein [Aquimarina sp. 2201CG5-10]
MSQLPRLISILTLLKSKRILTAPELAKKYEVSVRTIYRDIRKLEEAGVPVYTIEGRGYSLVDNYTVAPVQFTEKQANALVTAQHIINQSKDVSFVNNFNEALIKIKSVFKTSVQKKSELLNDKIHIFNWSYEEFTSDALSEIQLAITNFNFIEINYQKVNEETTSFRKIEPCAMYSADNKWILIAWCHLRNDLRAFRIDRIRRFKILEEQFEDRKFSLKKYFETCPFEDK